MPTINLSELELEYLRETITDVMTELRELHPENYFLRELADALALITPEEEK
jgi:hypothetical protein